MTVTRPVQASLLPDVAHHTGSGPGGTNIFEPKRARRHHSYLIVFTKASK